MIASLQALAAALAADEVLVDDIVARLGGEAEDLGSNVVVTTPAVEGVTQVNVVRDGDAPAFMTLELAAPLGTGELEAEFGEPRRVYPDHKGLPVDLLFSMPVAITLVAAEGADGVRRVTLRRD